MANKRDGFNLSEAIRAYRKAHRGVSAKNALAGIRKAHPSQKINEGTFKSTFYKLAGTGKRRVVKKRKPWGVFPGHGSADHIMKAGLNFIVAAGGVEQARERLVGLEALIEAAKKVD